MLFKNKENIMNDLQSDAEIFALLASFYLTNPNGVYAKGVAALDVATIADRPMRKMVQKYASMLQNVVTMSLNPIC